mmetsp:Transcript_59649/g.134604  ORF Transcript_59649/g.134604 Transcript_59649/m.134604 type:complete len:200 (+) Transcript_59649:152-751(+)
MLSAVTPMRSSCRRWRRLANSSITLTLNTSYLSHSIIVERTVAPNISHGTEDAGDLRAATTCWRMADFTCNSILPWRGSWFMIQACAAVEVQGSPCASLRNSATSHIKSKGEISCGANFRSAFPSGTQTPGGQAFSIAAWKRCCNVVLLKRAVTTSASFTHSFTHPSNTVQQSPSSASRATSSAALHFTGGSRNCNPKI